MNAQTDLKINEAFRSLIPPLSDHELKCLEAEIRYWAGCYSQIITWNGTIIDGHHRYAICKKHGLPFKTEERQFDSEKDVEIWMLKNQFSRRNLTDFIRGELTLALKSLLREKAVENSSSNNRYMQTTEKENDNNCQNFDKGCEKDQKDWNENRVDAQVGRLAGISREQVCKIEKLKATSDDQEIEDLRSGKVSIHKAFREVQRQERKEKLKTTEFPQGKYRVIYADPPWPYSDELVDGYGVAEKHYPTMSISELCEMPIADITDDNAVLFLWVTSPLLEDSFKIISSWGFKYKTSFVWDKVKHNMGHYNSVKHEFFLVCTKGSCVPDERQLFDSVQSIERSDKHSEKPECFREIIDTLYKHGNKIELFARKKVEGWEVFGNEL